MTTYRIKDVAHINPDKLADSTNPDFEFKYIDIGSVDQYGNINIPDSVTRFDRAPSRARRLAQPGDTIVSTVRTYLRAIATVPHAKETLVFSTGFAVLRAGGQVDNRFLVYYCRSEPFINEVVARSVGVSYPAINPSDLASIDFPMKPTDEQRRIADFLDAETARIDTTIGLRTKQLEVFEERTYAEVTETLLPGALTSATGRPPYPWLPDLPTDRPLVKLAFVCSLQSGLTVDSNRPVAGDVVTRPYLRVANVQVGHLKLDDVTEITVPRAVAARTTLRVGDVLMTEGGDIDKLGRGTVWRGELPGCLHQNHIFALRPIAEKLLGEYLALMTQTVHGRCYFESTGIKTTNLASTNSSKILAFKIPLPEVVEQRRLVQTVQRRLSDIQRMKSLLERQISLLQERRRALITAAVTGEFDVSTASGRGIED